MGLPFNFINPGWNIEGLLTGPESQFVTDLVLASGSASEDDVLTWKSGAPSWEPGGGGGGYTNLTEFVDQTAWRVFYSNTSGDVTELALGADGTYLKSNGATSAPSFDTPGGSGDVSKVGTPVNNQIGIWTGDGTIEGDAALTYDGTSLNLATGKNFQIAGGTVLADAAGTLTLSGIDALDATTEATIEAAIDTLANLTSIQGRTVTLADAGADAIFGWDDSVSAYENLTQAEVLAVIGDSSATAKGVVELATNAETVTGSDTVRATTPANLTAKMSAPGTIGNTTPGAITGTTITVNTGLMPDANDGAYLGQSGTAFSDLYLASGAAINFNAGDVTITHGSNTLTFVGASSGYSFDGQITGNSFVPTLSTVPSNGLYISGANTLAWSTNTTARMQLTTTALSPASDGGLSLGTTALGWQNLFGNTGFVMNLENGNWVATHTSGILTVGTGDLRVTTAGTNTASVVTAGGTQTVTNKRITKRTGTTTSSATPTINTDDVDEYYITAQTADITSFTTNLSGTPTLGQGLFISVIGTAARAITWGASFANGPVALPTTTVTTTQLSTFFKWDGSIWRCYATGSTV